MWSTVYLASRTSECTKLPKGTGTHINARMSARNNALLLVRVSPGGRVGDSASRQVDNPVPLRATLTAAPSARVLLREIGAHLLEVARNNSDST